MVLSHIGSYVLRSVSSSYLVYIPCSFQCLILTFLSNHTSTPTLFDACSCSGLTAARHYCYTGLLFSLAADHCTVTGRSAAEADIAGYNAVRDTAHNAYHRRGQA